MLEYAGAVGAALCNDEDMLALRSLYYSCPHPIWPVEPGGVGWHQLRRVGSPDLGETHSTMCTADAEPVSEKASLGCSESAYRLCREFVLTTF